MAPPRKQAENRENKHFPAALGGFCLLERVGRIEVEKLKKKEDKKVKKLRKNGISSSIL